MGRFASGVLVAMVVAGCGDPLVERQLIVDTRVLAARAEVVAEPARATPFSGEEALVRFYVVGPEGAPPSIHWRFEACVADATTSGLVRCRESVAVAEGDHTAAPEIAFAVPEVAPNAQLAVVGIVCDGAIGSAAAPWPAHRCAQGVDHLTSFVVATQPASPANHNPDAGRDAFALGEIAWNDGDCEGDAPRVAANSEHRVRWSVGADNRELVGETRESLLLSHFVTGGMLERAFSRVDAALGDPAQVEVRWTAPEVAAGEQRAVTFHFVARDGRGGSDWTSRIVCVDG